MLSGYNHIISTFNWNTFLDEKERASELQARLSAWSGINMQKEINEVFNKLCPPDQTWRIDQLELDLGVIEMDTLESDLARRLRMQLTEKLTDLIIYADKAGQNNIEITNQYDAPIDKLRSYLLNGVMPWNYKASDGTLNQLLSWQFQHNRQILIALLKEVGTTHEDVRKRMAWQMNEPNIQKTIEGFEPGSHEQINRFSSELIKIQTKENVVRAGTADFKKNVWLWILNYLLTERGTLFNKHAFLKSSIVQMSAHYNIGYEELLELLNEAVDQVSKSTAVKADFLIALKALSKENAIEEVKSKFSNVPGIKIDDKVARLLLNTSKIKELINVQAIVKHYTTLLQPVLTSWSKKKISSKLGEIFWKTVLDYSSHKGNIDSFKRLFKASIVYHLPINKAQLDKCLSKPEVATKSHTYFFASTGVEISFHKVFQLLEQCLQSGTTTVVENGNTFTLREMVAACFEYHPAMLRDIIKGLIKTNHYNEKVMMSLIRESFRHFDRLQPDTLIPTLSEKLRIVYRKGLVDAFENIPIPGITCVELQQILFKKLMQALIANNWKIIAADEIIKDLIRSIAPVKNISKTDFAGQLIKFKQLLPATFQLSIEKFQEDIVAKPFSKKIHQPMKPKDKPVKTGTHVRNAGIVLLNSYIPMLLERLNLIKEKKFLTPEAQEQAVLYLQYVVTGANHAEETDLALNKLLCGLLLSKPVKDSIEISDEHKDLIEGLIKAAINYWPSIGNCSVDGFRGNWLVRDGLLIEHEDKWELVVEKRAYDILINHSPFSFSIIKYLWMNKPLHVSWAY